MREGWKEVKLGGLLKLQYGKALPKGDRVAGGVPVVGSAGRFDEHDRANTQTGDEAIVVGRKGTAGSVTYFDSPVWVTDTAYWVDPLVDIDLRMLHLLLQHVDLASVCAQTGVPGLNRDRAYELPVYLPSLREQRGIVDLIGAVEDAIEAAMRQVIASRNAASAVRNAMFESASQKVDRVPAGSKFDMLLGRQKSARQSVGDHVIPYLRAGNISSDGFLLSSVQTMNFSPTEQEKYCLREGDVMLVEGGSLGQSSMWAGEIEGPVGFDKHVIRLRGVEGFSSPEYALQWTRWAYETGAFDAQATGVTIRALGFGRAKAMLVPDLTLFEQERLVEPLMAADAMIALARDYVNAFRALRSSLLTALLSGEYEIHESYDERVELL